MAEMTPQEAEYLARGYAWGYADAEFQSVSKTADGIAFGTAYRQHVGEGNGSRYSVQRAYTEWRQRGYIPPCSVNVGRTITKC